MVGFIPDRVILDEYESQALFNLESVGPGVYTKPLEIRGNSILSTLFVRSIDPGATIEIKYWDTTTGKGFGERYDLTSHLLVNDSVILPYNERVTVIRIHNSPNAEVTITGGNVEFGLYITVVSSFALDASLVRDEQPFYPLTDLGFIFAGIDDSTNKIRFIRVLPDGSISVSMEEAGDPFFIETQTTIDENQNKTLLSFTVPAGTIRKLSEIKISSRVPGIFTLTSGGVIIASGRTSPGRPDCGFNFNPKRPISEGVLVELNFQTLALPIGSHSIEAYVMASDFI